MTFETIETADDDYPVELQYRRDWSLVRIEVAIWLTIISVWLLIFAHGPHLP